MEILLAIVVVAAVIFFGALISIGNERQRKAIDNLQEKVVFWAVQDLKIKREKLSRNLQVIDPVEWLSKMASMAIGREMGLQMIKSLDNPQAIVCETVDGIDKYLFTTAPPAEIRRNIRKRRVQISKYVDQNPLSFISRNAPVYELSVLNSGILFDLELQLTWRGLTGKDVLHQENLWIYKLS